MGKRVALHADFKVEYVPLSPKMVEVRRASLLLLMRWIREDLILNLDAREERDEIVDRNCDGHAGGRLAALFSLEDVVARKKAAKTRSIYAWFVGHDGSAYRMVMGSQ